MYVDFTPEQLALRAELRSYFEKLISPEIRSRLRTARATRVPPLRDDKQLVAWNGLMIQAFARAGLAFRKPALVERGGAAARALLERAHRDGELARYLKDGKPHGHGVLDDYAFFIAGLLDLFEASGERAWLAAAIALQEELDRGFFDDAAGGYWISPAGGERLIVREKPVGDGALPSGNSLAASNLLRLYHLTTRPAYLERAEMTLRAFSERLEAEPSGHGRLLEAVDFLHATPKEILIVTPGSRDGAEPFLVELGSVFLPNRVIAVAAEDDLPALVATIPLFEEKRALRGKVTAYVCENRVCARPAQDPALFARQIKVAPKSASP